MFLKIFFAWDSDRRPLHSGAAWTLRTLPTPLLRHRRGWHGCAGKMSLDGSVAQRLDQLDKRETELLKKIDDQAQLVKKLKDDRAYYRSKCDEKE